MEDLQEEAERLFDDILKGEPSAIEEYRACVGVKKERFLDLMDKRQHDDGSNMLIFAITNRKYRCARTILEILKLDVEEDRSSNILLARDNEGNDLLRILMLNSAHPVKSAVLLDNPQLTSDDRENEKTVIDELFKLLLQFPDAIQQLATAKGAPGAEGDTGEGAPGAEGDTGEGAPGAEGDTGEGATGAEGATGDEVKVGRDGIIFWAIKNKLGDFGMDILSSLHSDQQLNIIANKEQCTNKCHPNKHGEECRVGYNLLMMALVTPIHEPLVQTIVKILLSHRDQLYKSRVVMGNDRPEVFSQSENCLRLAAKSKRGELVIQLLEECVPDNLQCDALLEVGPPGGSVMKHLLFEQGELINLKKFLKKNADRGELLRESLAKSAERKRNFLQLEMRLSAIELFEEIELFRRSFLIPRPGALSRPLSLNYCNRFSGEDELPRTREEVERLKKAIISLGWSIDDNLDWSKNLIKVCPVDWTTEEFIQSLTAELNKVKDSCSLFLLCVTSHGEAGRVLGVPKEGEAEMTSEYLDRIVAIITFILPEFIPKVLIFDMCRTEPEDEGKRHTTLRENNILVLYGTAFGTDSDEMTYTPALAKQIQKADGVISLQTMHNQAAQKVKTQPQGATANRLEDSEQVSEGDDGPQIGHMESTVSRDIILRKYYGDKTNCNYCGEDVRYVTDRVICFQCLKWYHFACITRDETQKSLNFFPDSDWPCSACVQNIMQL